MDEAHKAVELMINRQPPSSAEFLNAEWLAGVSHELRSPLAAIKGYASLLLRHEGKLAAEERREFLYAISESSDRITQLLDSFLELAHLEASEVQLHLASLDMVQLVQEVIARVSSEAQSNSNGSTSSSRITFRQEAETLSAPAPCIIQADRLLIQRMIIHLLDNAQKYSAQDALINVTITLYAQARQIRLPARLLSQLEGQQPVVELRIQDQGIGILPQDHERIFERFQRVDTNLTREVAGLGLGLTICKRIVDLHHGLIWVESMLGSGSTFHVLLPTRWEYEEGNRS